MLDLLCWGGLSLLGRDRQASGLPRESPGRSPAEEFAALKLHGAHVDAGMLLQRAHEVGNSIRTSVLLAVSLAEQCTSSCSRMGFGGAFLVRSERTSINVDQAFWLTPFGICDSCSSDSSWWATAT